MWNHVLGTVIGFMLLLTGTGMSDVVDSDPTGIRPTGTESRPLFVDLELARAHTDGPDPYVDHSGDQAAALADRVTFVNAVSEPTAHDFQSIAWLTDTAGWAVGLFDQAGLSLPPLRFVFHLGDMAGCNAAMGLHHRVEGVSVIDICSSEPLFATKATMLHETAHAWADHSLTAERKAAFQKLRGWRHWHDYEAAAWAENGTEQAAEIVVWGLLDQPVRRFRIDQHSCDELEAGYLTLTGSDPLHGFRDHC